MSRRRKLGRVTRDRWFESGSLQQRVCELSAPNRRSPSCQLSSKLLSGYLTQPATKRIRARYCKPCRHRDRTATGWATGRRRGCAESLAHPSKSGHDPDLWRIAATLPGALAVVQTRRAAPDRTGLGRGQMSGEPRAILRSEIHRHGSHGCSDRWCSVRAFDDSTARRSAAAA